MQTNLGFKIKRRKGKNHANAMKCYSCNVGSCNGFLKAVDDNTNIVDCTSYEEQIFKLNDVTMSKLISFVEDIGYSIYSGEHNISQGPSFGEMMMDIKSALHFVLTHRHALNTLKNVGHKWAPDFMEEVRKLDNR